MYVLTRIASYFGTIASFFNDIYVEVEGWVWPFYKAADFFWYIRYFFYKLEAQTIYFSEDMEDFIDELGYILSWSSIRSLISSWLYGIENVIEWWSSWWTWIRQEVNWWWSSTQYTVQGWIASAVQGFNDLINSVETALNTLQAAWDDFWTVILPNLLDITWLTSWWASKLLEIDTLINSWFLTWTPFWEGWLDVKDTVIEFFNDPLEWLWQRFLDWFLGPEV